MKKSILTLLTILLLTGTAFAVDKTATFAWNQDCIVGCTLAVDGVDAGSVVGWRIYASDISGVYGTTPIVDLPYNGTPAPSYTSSYVLSLTGAGTKYFVVTAYNANDESGNSNEVNYPYNFAGPATPVTFTFTIQAP